MQNQNTAPAGSYLSPLWEDQEFQPNTLTITPEEYEAMFEPDSDMTLTEFEDWLQETMGR